LGLWQCRAGNWHVPARGKSGCSPAELAGLGRPPGIDDLCRAPVHSGLGSAAWPTQRGRSVADHRHHVGVLYRCSPVVVEQTRHRPTRTAPPLATTPYSLAHDPQVDDHGVGFASSRTNDNGGFQPLARSLSGIGNLKPWGAAEIDALGRNLVAPSNGSNIIGRT